MPVVFRDLGFKFFFFSNEGDPLEPVHVHVRKGGAIAKLWVAPEVQLADSFGFKPADLRKIVRLVEENKDLIVRSWNEHFGL